MAHLQYLVLYDQGQWKISHDDRFYGSYETEQQAVSRAMEEAFSNSMNGHKAEVLSKDLMGEFMVECSYGRDSKEPH